ncbi:MAG: Zn-ribbon domain-containing OB-fold protein [Aeromicrobium sp.]
MINRDSAYFWEGTQKQELRIQSCGACGALRHPPGPACPTCGAFDRSYVVASGTGTVFSFVIHRHPPVPGKELPLVLALVDLDEGVRMVGEVPPIDGDSVEDLAIGDRVQIDWNVVDDELTLPIWRRA